MPVNYPSNSNIPSNGTSAGDEAMENLLEGMRSDAERDARRGTDNEQKRKSAAMASVIEGVLREAEKKSSAASRGRMKSAREIYEETVRETGSEELARKDRERRRREETEYSAVMDSIEEGLCAKFKITPPPHHINSVRNDRKTDDGRLLLLGQTVDDKRNPRLWGITQVERTFHSQLIGPSGSGKSTLLKQLMQQDSWYHRGGLLLEPHGDLVQQTLESTPPYRIHDTVFLNALDAEYSPGFNPMELPQDATDEQRANASGAVVSLMSKLGNMDSGMVQLAKNLELALNILAYVPGATMLEVMDFYRDEDFRRTAFSFVPDSSRKEDLMATAATVASKADATASLENRMLKFSNNRYLRHLFGQSHSTFDFYSAMNAGKIVLCPVSKGETEDDSFTRFFGSFVISTIYKAATMRRTIAEEDRIIFPLTIDEFQNFLSDEIENMLAELRKYGLPMMLAHQYINQLPPGIASAMDNSTKTKISYNLGPTDAAVMAKAMHCSSLDLMNIPRYQTMVYRNEGGFSPFISKVFPPMELYEPCSKITTALIDENSRANYMRPRAEIENEILERKELYRHGSQENIVKLMTKKNA